ncbi:hypothetical protein HispidOSU_019045, partial [Sigmodon hispidus]
MLETVSRKRTEADGDAGSRRNECVNRGLRTIRSETSENFRHRLFMSSIRDCTGGDREPSSPRRLQWEKSPRSDW